MQTLLGFKVSAFVWALTPFSPVYMAHGVRRMRFCWYVACNCQIRGQTEGPWSDTETAAVRLYPQLAVDFDLPLELPCDSGIPGGTCDLGYRRPLSL